jgi:hypothetical protein
MSRKPRAPATDAEELREAGRSCGRAWAALGAGHDQLKRLAAAKYPASADDDVSREAWLCETINPDGGELWRVAFGTEWLAVYPCTRDFLEGFLGGAREVCYRARAARFVQ